MPILTRLLLQKKLVTRSQLNIAIRSQVVFGGRLGTNLIELDYISEQDLGKALAEKFGVPFIDASAEPAEKKLLSRVPIKYVEKYKVFPWRLKGKTMQLMMVNPSNRIARAEISFATGLMIQPLAIPEYRMLHLLQQHYGISPEWRFGVVREAEGGGAETAPLPGFEEGPPTVLDLTSAGERIDAAADRDVIIKTALDFFSNYYHRVVIFMVRKGFAYGWGGKGKALDEVVIRALIIPLDGPSAFKTVVDGGGHYLGALRRQKINIFFLKSLGGAIPKNSFITPVTLGGRVVNIIYCDNGAGSTVDGEIGDLLLLSRRMGAAYEKLLRQRLEQAVGA